jgi:hypothetical protein
VELSTPPDMATATRPERGSALAGSASNCVSVIMLSSNCNERKKFSLRIDLAEMGRTSAAPPQKS